MYLHHVTTYPVTHKQVQYSEFKTLFTLSIYSMLFTMYSKIIVLDIAAVCRDKLLNIIILHFQKYIAKHK